MPMCGGYGSVLTLIILCKVFGFGGYGCVLLHDVIIHESRATEQGETARTAENTAKDVLSCFLEPVAHSVLELLVPLHVAAPCRHSQTSQICINIITHLTILVSMERLNVLTVHG